MSIHSTFFFFFFETFLFLSSSDCAYLLEKFGRVSFFFSFFSGKKRKVIGTRCSRSKNNSAKTINHFVDKFLRVSYIHYTYSSDRIDSPSETLKIFVFSSPFALKKKSFRFRGGWTFFFSLFYVHANELLRFLFFFKKTKNKGWNGLPQGTQDF